jgi:maltoporin
MKIKISAIAAAVAAATLSMAADAATIDFHGYARSGVGSATKGGSLVCYNLGPNNLGHFRLGNECDTYLELQFDSLLAEKAGTQFKFHTMLAQGTQQIADWEKTTPALRQLWVEATNVGAGPLANSSLWAGKRYYKRQDIHMLDMFYNEVSGPGAGIEGIDVAGAAKFSLAYMRKGETDWKGSRTTLYQNAAGQIFGDKAKCGAGCSEVNVDNYAVNNFSPNFANGGANSVTNIDLRLEGLAIGDFGSVDFMGNIVKQNNRVDWNGVEADAKNGWALTGQHTIGVLGGFNRAILQYAKDGASLNGSANVLQTTDYKGYRFLDHLVFDFGAINGSAVIGYQNDKSDASNQDDKTWTIGVRPWYHFNDLYSVGTEIGHVQVKPKKGDTKRMEKVTLAAQIAPGKGFWTRPALRAYYTYAKWNDAAKGDGVARTGRDNETWVSGYSNSTNGSTYGLQMEAWW